jgi:hypothetical protein
VGGSPRPLFYVQFCPEVECEIHLMANRKFAHNVTSGCIVEYSLHTGRISKQHIKPGRRNKGCFKKSFTVVFQMLLCGVCYENIST